MENNLKARVHSIETFGTVDGPGIRFVLFLQGCNLKCNYCHNKDACTIDGGSIFTLNELLAKAIRYKQYFLSSGGGVTVSGGEPLIQAKFVIEFFKKLKENGLHTALDTSGSLPITAEIEELLKYTDLVLLDIKHINNEKCIELTGHPNQNTLQFAKYLNNKNIPTWIRQVIVPGITDDTDDLLELKEFLSTLNNIKNIELLPYHKMGQFKWEELGFIYPLRDIREANDNDIKKVKEILGV